MQSAEEMALKNYGKTWTIEMMQALVTKGRLTVTQYESITGQTYINPTNADGTPIVTLDALKEENTLLKSQLETAQTDNLMALEAIATIYEMMLANQTV